MATRKVECSCGWTGIVGFADGARELSTRPLTCTHLTHIVWSAKKGKHRVHCPTCEVSVYKRKYAKALEAAVSHHRKWCH